MSPAGSVDPDLDLTLDLHAILDLSRANGPGARLVIWFQGCPLACRGCFNPETHSFEPRIQIGIDALMERIARAGEPLEGVSISGGEPFAQPEGLFELVRRIRTQTGLSTLIFSGYRRDEIEAMPLGPAILAHSDLLIAGRFIAARPSGQGLLGSANQCVHLLSDRYDAADIAATPEAEVYIAPNGDLICSGIAPPTPF